MAVDLSNTRAVAAGALLAYASETLQAVKALNLDEIAHCSYEGPCAIGVSIEPETRVAWDKEEGSQSISAVIWEGRAVGDEDALSELQAAHDRFATSPWSEKAHLNFLIVTEFYARGLNK